MFSGSVSYLHSLGPPLFEELLIGASSFRFGTVLRVMSCSAKQTHVSYAPLGGPMFLLCFARRTYISYVSRDGPISLMFHEMDPCLLLFFGILLFPRGLVSLLGADSILIAQLIPPCASACWFEEASKVPQVHKPVVIAPLALLTHFTSRQSAYLHSIP